MRLHRFYTTEKLEREITYTHESQIHQWRTVFRYGTGDRVLLFGDGYEHEYELVTIDKKEARLIEISKVRSKMQEKEITLALALIKKDNFELALSKCTEIGITHFIPLITERSFQKEFNRERIEKLLIEATEQSGWGKVPVLLESQNCKDGIKEKNSIVFDMGGVPLGNVQSGAILYIGPEGGWSDTERELFRKNNATVATISNGTLRAETAAILASGFALINID